MDPRQEQRATLAAMSALALARLLRDLYGEEEAEEALIERGLSQEQVTLLMQRLNAVNN